MDCCDILLLMEIEAFGIFMIQKRLVSKLRENQRFLGYGELIHL